MHTIVPATAFLGEGFTPSSVDVSRAFATKSDRMHWFDRSPEAAIYDGAFNVPMLWNSNFFMTLETMKILRLLIDVWLPDFQVRPRPLRDAPCEYAVVLGDRHRQSRPHPPAGGELHHPASPNHVECCTYPVLDWVAEHMPEVPINIMDQCRPENFCDPRSAKYRPQDAELEGRPTGEELRKAYRRARALNLQFETITFEKYTMQSAPAALTL